MKKEFNQEEIKHLQSKYALDEHFSKKEFNHSHQEGVSGHTSSLSPEDKEPSFRVFPSDGSEFNLSKKAIRDLSNNPIPNYYWEQDVKEFIKIVLIDCSEAFESNELEIVEFIMKKRAGKELI